MGLFYKINIMAILIAWGHISFSQSWEGNVFDESRQPVVGAYVYHLNTQAHAHTNDAGYFKLKNVAIGDTVQISMIGYKNLSITVEDLNQNAKIILEDQLYRIDEIVVSEDASAIRQLARIDLKNNPVRSSQEILRVVPGLFVAQHAGGGKAEQIFLRGFDIDHGTDIALSVDGMPVNMVSHAHGQGYSDLHFIIPEAIEGVEFNKGPFYLDKGNFTTAGYADFQLKERFEKNLFSLEIGELNSTRVLGLFNIINNEKNNLYVGSTFKQTDGPVESPQNFDRLNFMARYSSLLPNEGKLNMTFSHFTSQWDASGQIPIGEVENGNITRWGAIDDTEGGQTKRTNFQISYNRRVDKNTFIKNNIYYSNYQFELFSNFTFFLRDTVDGDQIVQRENRNMFGLQREINKSFELFGKNTLLKAGIGMRADYVKDVELSDTKNRLTVKEVRQLGDVTEVDAFGFAGLDWEAGDWTISPGLRLDVFSFQYYDRLAADYQQQTKQTTILNPKLNIQYRFNQNAMGFLKVGSGFHSNDSRVVVERSNGLVPRAIGLDVGTIFKPFPKVVLQSTLWYLGLESEFVYVGDEGVVEPSGETERYGIDLGVRYQILDGLYFDTDWTWTEARAINEPEGADHIPLAPIWTGTGGLSLDWKAFNAALRMRYLGDRPANEDNSIVARGYFIMDFNMSYQWKKYTLAVVVENIFDREWEEAQFATESRVRPSALPVEEIHFTPGFPRFVRASVSYSFE